MAAAEGPLARLAEHARARVEARLTPPPPAGRGREGVEAGKAPPQPGGELGAQRESESSARDIDSVAEHLALQQQLDTARRTLQEKERLVDATATQCRRLEDDLEDQHRAYDGLKQDLEREKRSLAAAREQVARLSQERHEIEEHYQALLSTGRGGRMAEGFADSSRLGIPRRVLRFVVGLGAGILIATVVFGVWVQLEPFSVKDAQLPGRPEIASPGEKVTDDENAGTEVGPKQPGPLALGTARDRLSDGSTGPLMLVLKGGAFTMGRQLALPDDDDGPAHEVHLNGFLIGATEVTFDEYDRFARATGRRIPSDFGWGRGRRPVVDVSWEDARAYAQWLSRRTGQHYRLPSESEWEFAAAAGQRSFFWWGNSPEQERAICFDCGTAWDNRSSAPVGTFEPNPLGLYDTAGNVMEWVEDCYHSNYGGAPSNGQPWGEESCSFRVARGGAFNKPARSMRTTARHRFAAETRINSLGFRLARDE